MLLFIGMAARIGYFVEKESFHAINNTYNKRSDILEQQVLRGNIYSSNKEILATTKENEDGSITRVYPYDNLFCHIVGSYDMGKMGLELYRNYTMLQYNENMAQIIKADLAGEKIKGNSLYTTLDVNLQKICYEALGDNKGAIIVSEPATGKILAMVSKPDYNPNSIVADWDKINTEDENESRLINRATQGLYAPGSTFKVITFLEYMRQNKDSFEEYEYSCKGKAKFEGAAIKCYKNISHGKVDIRQAMADSCNCTFADMGVLLDPTSFNKTISQLRIAELNKIDDFNIKNSSIPITDNASKGDMIQLSIGQGTTLLTPLQNSLIVNSIANNGIAMTPYVVDKVVADDGTIMNENSPKVYSEYMTATEADVLKDYMKEVCVSGTADDLKELSYECAGKTGSAQYTSGTDSHAWFIGFAPADNPKISVSIIVEGGGSGGKVAVPIAKKIFMESLGK